jgi:cytochrome c-type biogenesis protein CcsB
MIFIAWALLLAGLLFSRRSPLVLSVTALFAGIVLLVAHLSWMNPQITNLVPVLKSYWLTLHVAIIIGGYGFMTLGALLGFLNLFLTGLQTHKNRVRISLAIDELTAINEMALVTGLYLMTIGSFLGGIWANESWGRYWGWDPKETWSLITVLIYAFVVHMRMIPGLRGRLAFNTASLLSFASVVMTYLGVNYYLTGLHSYAAGDPVPVPAATCYILIIVALLIGYAWWKEKSTLRDSF